MQGAEDLRHVLGRGIGGETCHETVDARGHLLGTRPEEPAADRVGKRFLARRRGIDGQRSELAFEPRQPRIVNLYIVRDVHIGELLDRGDDAAFMRIGKSVLDFAVPRAVDVDTRVDGNPEERERDVIGIDADQREVDERPAPLLGRRGVRMDEHAPEQLVTRFDGRELLGNRLGVEYGLEGVASRLLVDEHTDGSGESEGDHADDHGGEQRLSRLDGIALAETRRVDIGAAPLCGTGERCPFRCARGPRLRLGR